MTTLDDAAVAADPLRGRLTAIFDSVADGVTVMDRAGRIVFANDTGARLLGRERADELIGMTGAQLLGEWEILDDAGEPLPADRMPTRRALAGETEPEETVRFRRRGSADDRWSLVRARLLNGGSPEDDLVVTAFQDITSLKRSESRLQFLSEASAILGEAVDYQQTLRRVAEIAVPDLADWCVVDVLEWTRGITRVAVAHADQAKVAATQELWQRWPSDPARSGAVYEMTQRRGPLLVDPVTPEMLRAQAQDAEHLAFLESLDIRSVLVVPLEARGEVLGAFTLVQSESGRRFGRGDVEVAAELGRRAGAAIDVARLVWETHENARLRDEFIAVASHDMRTPLAAIRGYAQLAGRHVERSETPDREQLQRWLSDVDASVDRLAHLVSELLDATLVRADQSVPLHLEEVKLSAVAGEVLERHRPLSDRHSLVLLAPKDEPTGHWDASRVARVLDNIVGNAVKFSPDGGEVVVRVGYDGARASVEVSDQGIGIAASEREKIFNPMYRGGNAEHVAGTGLGLAGSRRLVELMGGTIQVESRIGHGSTFTVWLPLAPAGDEEAAGP
ncbi:MAG TPA: PAS domain-containing sensor histidine kinase [Candidatus Limnocylindria bacterium]